MKGFVKFMPRWNKKAFGMLLSPVAWILSVILSIDASMVPNLLPQEFYKHHGNHIVVASICILLLGFVVFLMERTSKRGDDNSSRSEPAAKAFGDRETLIWYMKRLWIEGVLEQSLYAAARLNLGMHEHEAAVAHPKEFIVPQFLVQPGDNAVPSVAEDTSAAALLRRLGSFVILGAPGSGKTTRIAELVQQLINDAKNDNLAPLPLAVQLSSWGLQRGTIDDWLISEVGRNVRLSDERVRKLIANANLVVLLDGLDEVAARYRSECVAEINRFRANRPETRIVVSCRKDDYDELLQKLDLDSGIAIQPLTRAEIDSALDRRGRELSGLKNALAQSPELYEVLGSPLMMEIAIVTFAGTNAISASQTDDKAELQRMFIRKYIERMLDPRRTRKGYASDRMVPALSWIAANMRSSSLNEFTEEDLVCTVWVKTKRWQLGSRARDVIAFSVNGLVWGTVFGSAGNLAGRYLHVRATGFLAALLGGCTGAIVASFILLSLNFLSAYTIWQRPVVTEKAKTMAPRIMPLLTRWKRFIFIAAVVFLLGRWALRVCGLIILLRCAYTFPPGPAIGLSVGATVSVAWTLADWYLGRKPPGLGGEALPTLGITKSFDTLLQQDSTKGVVTLLALAAHLAMLIPLAGFLEHVRKLSLRAVLWVDGIMPLAHGDLLEGATARAFLRRTSNSYQFIHPLLMDFFATSSFFKVQ